MKKHIDVVAAAIIDNNGKIYICKRSKTMTLANYWEFPGGKIEENETHQVALIREIKEELNCEIDVKELIDSTTYEYDTFIITLHVYYATLKKNNPQISEHSDACWVLPSELHLYNFAPANTNICNKLLSISLI